MYNEDGVLSGAGIIVPLYDPTYGMSIYTGSMYVGSDSLDHEPATQTLVVFSRTAPPCPDITRTYEKTPKPFASSRTASLFCLCL